MKKLNLFFLMTFLLISSSTLKAWDSTAAKFYPLKIGNIYTFNHISLWFNCDPYQHLNFEKVSITDFVLKQNGKWYYKFSGWWYFPGFQPKWNYQRIDSNTMNVYAYDSINSSEFLLDSLLSNINNSFNCQRFNYQQPHGVYLSNSSQNLFGQIRIIKGMVASFIGAISSYYSLAEGIGFNGYSACEIGSGESYSLKGCVINGIVYGDTTLTSIKKISYIVQKKFSLYQNYPNPFNPNTIINYELPITNYVVLKVFDALGNQVTTLVNEKQNPGAYSVEFDGSNLSSGLYFYKLVTESSEGGFSETRRMILLK